MVLLVSPFRALTGSGSPPSKSLGEERECSVAWPIFLFFFIFFMLVMLCVRACVFCVSNSPRSNLTHILAAKIVGDLLCASPSLQEPGCCRD